MNMIFTGKVSGEKTALTAGGRHTVKAVPGEQYGLVDEATGLVPAGVEADRSGDDLILRNKEEDTEVRIEGFWEECQPGEMQCSAVFNVAGENGQVSEAVLTQDGPVLEAITAGESGTLAEGINPGIIWGGIAFGAGLAAIALAAGGGGGGGNHHRSASAQENTRPSVQGSDKGEPGSNGKPDDVDAKDKLKAATDLVAAAEAKQTEADGALTTAKQDGAINPAEHKDLTDKNQAVTQAKTPAADAVNALPEGQEKTELQGRLDKVTGIQVPDVNDTDSNGKPDDVDHLSKAGTPLYDGNINMSDPQFIGKFQYWGKTYNVPEGELQNTARSLYTIHQANPGGFTGTVTQAPETANLAGKLIFALNGDADKIVTTKGSLGNIASAGTKYIKDLDFTTHNGDDVFVIGQDIGLDNRMGQGVTINTGGGNDIFIGSASNTEHKVVYGDDGLRLEDKSYAIKDGESVFELNNYHTSGISGGSIKDVVINMGDGDDTFLHLGLSGSENSIHHATIDMGAGNDIVSVYGKIADNANNIKGGSGIDTLHHDFYALSSKDISGFETLNLGNKSALKLYADYLTKDGGIEGGILKINGESGTSVDLGNNGNNLSDNNGTWTKGEAKSEDGVNYHVYTHSANPGVQVWIDDDIKEVI